MLNLLNQIVFPSEESRPSFVGAPLPQQNLLRPPRSERDQTEALTLYYYYFISPFPFTWSSPCLKRLGLLGGRQGPGPSACLLFLLRIVDQILKSPPLPTAQLRLFQALEDVKLSRRPENLMISESYSTCRAIFYLMVLSLFGPHFVWVIGRGCGKPPFLFVRLRNRSLGVTQRLIGRDWVDSFITRLVEPRPLEGIFQ